MNSTCKKIHDEAEAQELLEQFEEYRGGFRSFCAEMDVDGRSLRAWQRRLTPETPPGLQLAELSTEAFVGSFTLSCTNTALSVILPSHYLSEALIEA